MKLPNLEQLPDHHRLEQGANTPGHDDEGIRDEHEVVQPGKERPVLVDLADERVNVLLKRQGNADSDG